MASKRLLHRPRTKFQHQGLDLQCHDHRARSHPGKRGSYPKGAHVLRGMVCTLALKGLPYHNVGVYVYAIQLHGAFGYGGVKTVLRLGIECRLSAPPSRPSLASRLQYRCWTKPTARTPQLPLKTPQVPPNREHQGP